jgi:tight adherence protein B
VTGLLAALFVAGGLFAAVVASRQRGERRLRDLSAVLVSVAKVGVDHGPASSDDLRAALARSGRVAERALADTGAFTKVRATLARSDWTLSAGEFFAVSLGSGLVGLLLGLTIAPAGLALLVAVVVGALPYLLVSRSVSRRRSAFEAQLPDVLDLLSASLESGSTVPQALELVVAEADEPTASEFARVLSATRLGATLVDSLDDMAERLDSRDLVYAVRAIAVQQRTGGRLAEVLRIVGEFMRARAELRREISALTAEGRISAWILGSLPVAIGGFIGLTNPRYISPLFTTSPGLVMVSGAGALMLVAIVMMRKLIRIEV